MPSTSSITQYLYSPRNRYGRVWWKKRHWTPFAPEDAVAEGSQQFLLSVLLDYDVLVGPRITVGDRLVPWGVC